MQTQIHISRKLEKIVSKFISEENTEQPSPLGKWNAHVFFVDRKKCWLIVNKSTRYALVLSDIKQADLKNITEIFQDTFYDQLVYDGILFDYDLIKNLIGEINFLKTDNDRSIMGTINDSIYIIKYQLQDFGGLENISFRELNHRLNIVPMKNLNWKYSREKMRELIISLTNS